MDPSGECIGPLAYACVGAVVGAVTGLIAGYLFDEDGCYEWSEALADIAIGGAMGGSGAW